MDHYSEQISRCIGCVIGFIFGWIGFGKAFEAVQIAFLGGIVTGTLTFFVHKFLNWFWNKYFK